MAAKGAHERFLRAPLDLGTDPEAFFRDNIKSGAHAWVTLKIEWGSTLVPRSPKGVTSHPNFEEETVGEGFWGAAEKLGVKLPETPVDGGARSQFAALESAHKVHIRGCLLHTVLRPRASLQAALQPYLDRIGEVAGFVAMHVRTGYADIKNATTPEQIPVRIFSFQCVFRYWLDARTHAHAEGLVYNGESARCLPLGSLASPSEPHAPPLPPPPALALRCTPHQAIQEALSTSKAPKWERYFDGDLNQRWDALNELLAAELPRSNDSPEMAGCAGGEKLEKPFVMGDGSAKGLVPFFTCAGQAAQTAAARKVANGERPPGWEEKWAVYVSTDSPGLNQLVVGISGLRGHVVRVEGGRGTETALRMREAAGSLCLHRRRRRREVLCDVDCVTTVCCARARPSLRSQIGCQHACEVHHSAHHGTQTETSELHTMVDLYILGAGKPGTPRSRASAHRLSEWHLGVLVARTAAHTSVALTRCPSVCPPIFPRRNGGPRDARDALVVPAVCGQGVWRRGPPAVSLGRGGAGPAGAAGAGRDEAAREQAAGVQGGGGHDGGRREGGGHGLPGARLEGGGRRPLTACRSKRLCSASVVPVWRGVASLSPSHTLLPGSAEVPLVSVLGVGVKGRPDLEERPTADVVRGAGASEEEEEEEACWRAEEEASSSARQGARPSRRWRRAGGHNNFLQSSSLDGAQRRYCERPHAGCRIDTELERTHSDRAG